MSKKLQKYLSYLAFSITSGLLVVSYTNCSATGFAGGLSSLSNASSGLNSFPDPGGSGSGGNDGSSDSSSETPPEGTYPNGTIVNVSNSSGLSNAIANAVPGHVITLAPGNYTIAQKINLNASGTASLPIVIRAAQLGQAMISVDAGSGYAEGFVVNAPYWIIENLDIQGTCASGSHSFCEHAVHIKGNADNLVVRNNYLHEFNAMIKGSGNPVSGSFSVFADDVVIKGNRLQNASARMTSNPVTFIDINGGKRWKIQENRIADFSKGAGDMVSYGAFLKGNSRDGLFEKNLVVCSKNHSGNTRIGLSFGGGGNLPATNNPVCESSDCTTLHTNGIMRNNIVINCSDTGIYLNLSAQTKVYNNTLINTNGIDVRFANSSAEIRNNVSNSTARIRDGGTMTTANNVFNANLNNIYFLSNLSDLSVKDGLLILGQGAVLGDVSQDVCSQNRQSMNDVGAIQYSGNNATSCASAITAKYNSL